MGFACEDGVGSAPATGGTGRFAGTASKEHRRSSSSTRPREGVFAIAFVRPALSSLRFLKAAVHQQQTEVWYYAMHTDTGGMLVRIRSAGLSAKYDQDGERSTGHEHRFWLNIVARNLPVHSTAAQRTRFSTRKMRLQDFKSQNHTYWPRVGNEIDRNEIRNPSQKPSNKPTRTQSHLNHTLLLL